MHAAAGSDARMNFEAKSLHKDIPIWLAVEGATAWMKGRGRKGAEVAGSVV